MTFRSASFVRQQQNKNIQNITKQSIKVKKKTAKVFISQLIDDIETNSKRKRIKGTRILNTTSKFVYFIFILVFVFSFVFFLLVVILCVFFFFALSLRIPNETRATSKTKPSVHLLFDFILLSWLKWTRVLVGSMGMVGFSRTGAHIWYPWLWGMCIYIYMLT